MSDNWVAPYLSAAANLSLGGNFDIDLDEVLKFKKLNVKEQDIYKFNKSKNLSNYNHNPIGFVYLIRIATFLFPFLGDQVSIIFLQSLVFLFINFIFLKYI